MRDIDPECKHKVPTGLGELDVALDGGVVPGQVIMIGGSPGVGKSTMVLEVADAMTKRKALNIETGRQARKKNDVLLATSEEDVEKVRARGIRIGKGDDVLLAHCREYNEIEGDLAHYAPEFGIIDSLKRLRDATSQQGAVTTMERIYQFADATKTTMFVLMGVNGDGDIAGMMDLQHIVDTILMLERDRKDSDYRTLRVLKNRHGSEDYVGLFEMRGDGIHSYDPSKHLKHGRLAPGQAFAIATLGGRCFPIEVQALAMSSEKSTLSVVGYPSDRVRTILAILGAHTDVDVFEKDIYVSIIGGLNFTDTAIDSAIAMAISSAIKKKALPARMAYVGELDLIGEIKTGARTPLRKEVADRHGFRVASAEAIGDIVSEIGRKS
jgi:DNA repair protein RadA/Sms